MLCWAPLARGRWLRRLFCSPACSLWLKLLEIALAGSLGYCVPTPPPRCSLDRSLSRRGMAGRGTEETELSRTSVGDFLRLVGKWGPSLQGEWASRPAGEVEKVPPPRAQAASWTAPPRSSPGPTPARARPCRPARRRRSGPALQQRRQPNRRRPSCPSPPSLQSRLQPPSLAPAWRGSARAAARPRWRSRHRPALCGWGPPRWGTRRRSLATQPPCPCQTLPRQASAAAAAAAPSRPNRNSSSSSSSKERGQRSRNWRSCWPWWRPAAVPQPRRQRQQLHNCRRNTLFPRSPLRLPPFRSPHRPGGSSSGSWPRTPCRPV